MIELKSQERVRLQTNEEWEAENCSGKPVLPAAHHSTILVFDTHRTTRTSRLVLVFLDNKTGEEVVIFFNVDVSVQRGKKRGQFRRTGHRGELFPPPRSKFRKFWRANIAQSPRRWASAHRELKPRLKGRIFTAEITTGFNARNEKPYSVAKNFRELKLSCNNSETISKQFRNRETEQGNRLNVENTELPEELNRPAHNPPYNPVNQQPNYPIHGLHIADQRNNCLACDGEGCGWCKQTGITRNGEEGH